MRSRLERIKRRKRFGERSVYDIKKNKDTYEDEVKDRKVRKTRRAADDDGRDYRRAIRGEDDTSEDSLPAEDVEDKANPKKDFPQVDRKGTDPYRRLSDRYSARRESRRGKRRYMKRVNEEDEKIRRYPRGRKNALLKEEKEDNKETKVENKENNKKDYYFEEKTLESLMNNSFSEINETMEEKDIKVSKVKELDITEARALPNTNLVLESTVAVGDEEVELNLVIEGLMSIISEDGLYECYISDANEQLFDRDSKVKVKVEEGKVEVTELDFKAFVESNNKKSHIIEGVVNLD